ncbi:MAG: hypothetical protein ACOYMN_19080, partial [Roseimicrobium sp.]
ADAMTVRFQRQPSGNGKYVAQNGGGFDNLSPWNAVGVFWEQTIQAVGGFFKLPTTNGITIKNATIGADLPTGKIDVNAPTGATIVAVGGGNIVGSNAGAVIANGGGNIVANGGGNIVGSNAGAIIANGGGNVIANGGGNIVAVGGGNIIANGGGNIVALGGNNFSGTPSMNRLASESEDFSAKESQSLTTDARDLAHLFVGDGGNLEAPQVRLENNSVLHLTDIADGIDPSLAPNNTTAGNVKGDLIMLTGSEWQIQIASRLAGGHDALSVTGSAILSGRLNVWFLNTFHTQINTADSFPLLTVGGSMTVAFTNVVGGRVDTSDGRGSFTVTVSPDEKTLLLSDYQPAALQPWQAWLATHVLPANTDPYGDSDGDGRKNLEEYGDGSNPQAADLATGTSMALADGFFTFTFRRYPAERSVVSYFVETGNDLSSWSPVAPPAVMQVRHVNDSTEEVTVRIPALSPEGRQFVRSRRGLLP